MSHFGAYSARLGRSCEPSLDPPDDSDDCLDAAMDEVRAEFEANGDDFTEAEIRDEAQRRIAEERRNDEAERAADAAREAELDAQDDDWRSP